MVKRGTRSGFHRKDEKTTEELTTKKPLYNTIKYSTMTTTATGNEQVASNDTTTAVAGAAASVSKAAFPEAVTHILTSNNGKRRICYYTFQVVTEDNSTDATTTTTTATSNKHPVLYLHGFPGSGLEGGLWARHVSAAGGMLFALDRPGFGQTDPPSLSNNNDILPSSSSSPDQKENNNNNDDDNNILMEQAIQDMWDVIAHEKWSEFSLIGVSGGGPYTLCFLNSYLDKCHHQAVNNNNMNAGDAHDHKMPPKLRAISLAAALCPCIILSKPKEDDTMLPNIKTIYDLVASQKKSWWSRFKLQIMMKMTAVLITYIPTSWLVKLSATIPNPQLPPPDQDVCRNDLVTSIGLVSSMKVAMQQGSHSLFQEACTLFRKTAPQWILSLQSFYQHQHHQKKKDLSYNDNDAALFAHMFPNICIHHGKLDVNVPVSNAVYMLEHIFFVSNNSSSGGCGLDTKQQQSATQNDNDDDDNNNNNNNGIVKLVVYDDLGHVSLLTTKTDDIARFAVLSSF